MADAPLLIIGASARAAAFSALRAGLQPWCADLFADLDLQARCPVQRLQDNYPQGFAKVIESDLPGAWMYTGGLENWPMLLSAWQERRPLWGVPSDCLALARDPVRVAHILAAQGLPTPETISHPPLEESGRWLVKGRRGAGGQGVREWFPDADVSGNAGAYWQEYVDGQPAAAIYVGIGDAVQLLGLTRQLVGLDWLNARPFQYCGSIGPLQPPAELQLELTAIGQELGRCCNLAGVFGIDGILADAYFWPVEINPRYTASVEVLEYATSLCAMSWHRLAFEAAAPKPSKPPKGIGFVGKAILFAPADLTFPADGPWLAELREPTPLPLVPDFADIPVPGERIPRGHPILTFFVQQARLGSCEDALRERAEELTHRLFPQAAIARNVSSVIRLPQNDREANEML